MIVREYVQEGNLIVMCWVNAAGGYGKVFPNQKRSGRLILGWWYMYEDGDGVSCACVSDVCNNLVAAVVVDDMAANWESWAVKLLKVEGSGNKYKGVGDGENWGGETAPKHNLRIDIGGEKERAMSVWLGIRGRRVGVRFSGWRLV